MGIIPEIKGITRILKIQFRTKYNTKTSNCNVLSYLKFISLKRNLDYKNINEYYKK